MGLEKHRLVTVEEYLAAELASPIKREYVGGIVYAMAGATNAHNRIASNVLISLGAQLRGRPCLPFNSDTKIRIRLPTHDRFYYPDVSVICRPNPQTDSFQDEPAVIVEVVSESTRRIDEGEKKDFYLTIPSLAAYVLLEQETAEAVVYRRIAQGFVREVYTDPAGAIPLEEIGARLPLIDAYDRVELPSTAADPR